MSVYASAYVWENSKQKGTALLLLLAIADMANRSGSAYPSVRTLGRYIRMDPRTVQRTLRELEESGELRIHENQGPKGCHLYQLVMNLALPLVKPEEGGDNLPPGNLPDDTGGPGGVTSSAKRGDTAMSPEPSGTKREPPAGPENPVDKSKVNPPAPMKSLAVKEFHDEIARKAERRKAKEAA